MSKSLQDILTEVQERIVYYHTLPKWKQRRRKYWEAYTSCVRIETMLHEGIEKERRSRKTASK